MRVITPGTLIEEQFLDGKQNNYLAAVAAAGETLALAYGDISTSYAAATAIAGDDAYDELLAELARIGPAEIVADVCADLRATIATAVEAMGARLATPSLGLVEARERDTFTGFSIDESLAIHRALEALSAFVKRTGVTNGELGEIEPVLYRRRQFMVLDPATRKHLELTRAQGQNPRATLLATLDKCETSMGSRMLARWILAPLVDREAITTRQDGVEALFSEHARRERIREILKGAFDLERIAQKVRFRRATPRDLSSLRRTLEILRPLRAAALPALAPLIERIGDFADVLDDLQRTLADEPPAQIGEAGAIRTEANAELAECVALRTDARSKLAELEERERERTGIRTLKVKYASPFGYAIEISRSYTGALPAEYVRKQTLTSGERYVTPELKDLESAISTAQARQERLERQLFEALLERVGERAHELVEAAGTIAEIDVLTALAQCAAERGYVRPSFVEQSIVSIDEGRHPVMEAVLHARFVPNDLDLKVTAHRFLLLTGPNMGGKSTYLRQAGLLAIMAQLGSFVPARRMELGVIDRIFTRIGAGDDLATGQSTFYLEMAEAANILRLSTERSLLLIDEVGRGTGTLDGLSIAQAICEFLLGLEGQAPLVLFATHFHELCALSDHWRLVANYHITAVENTARGGAPVFSHRVQPGSSSRSFGIEVARMAGLPDAVVERAQEIADALSGQADVEVRVPLRKKLSKLAPSERQLPLLS
jgi:DNA mismatch repair protein MutS